MNTIDEMNNYVLFEKEIEIINRIIVEAVKHGADSGGSYDMNEKNLTDAINTWLEFKGLSDEYVVKENEEFKLQIVPIDNELKAFHITVSDWDLDEYDSFIVVARNKNRAFSMVKHLLSKHQLDKIDVSELSLDREHIVTSSFNAGYMAIL